MTDIEQILKSEVEKYIDNSPYKNDKTIGGLSNRLKYVSENVNEVTENVNRLANEYLEKNPNIDAKELIEIAKNLIQRFLASPVNG
ncbi:hypothetical protein [Flavobacterium sp. 7A]|uniref:hypothetical protein n=1 Tax=Flavobacterium sp. 7A TaxID=2940571 RepID=UPI002226F4BC|nr:hypothetical protein [Flavobacterium sp. 7A]MCW2117991.1 hypothetical protein [Flavobacterium sp. 7A]